MVRKEEIVRFVADKEIVKTLDLLAGKTGTNRSMVIRELIPPVAVIDAMAVQAALEGRDSRNIARDIAISCVCKLAREMTDDPDHPIGLQYELLCSGLDPFIKTALLYAKWARAKIGTEGYRFEQIIYKGKATFTIVIGPNDSDKAIEVLKKQICDFAEKLGM